MAKKKAKQSAKKAGASRSTAPPRKTKKKATGPKTTKKVAKKVTPSKTKTSKKTIRTVRQKPQSPKLSSITNIPKAKSGSNSTFKTAKPVAEPLLNREIAFEMLDPNELPPTPLTPEDLSYFRELLLKKRAEIAGDVDTLQNQALSDSRQNASGDLSNMPIHMADLGTDNYEKEFTLGLLESERGILREIEEALKRIDNGTYGVCLATGRPIGKARLKAQPWVQYCYEYMLAQERGQQRKLW